MAYSDSYVTGAGEYPVAPNTTVEAYFQANPQYDNSRYRTLLMKDKATWTWDEKDWSFIRSNYDKWVQDLNNNYLADVEHWKTRYQTPLNQSELLEAAGYNRNWLEGASNSAPDIQAVEPSSGNAGINSYNPAQNIFASLQALNSAIGSAASISDVMASVDLKEAQAQKIRQTLPFELSNRYFPILEKAKEHGLLRPEDEMYHFESVPGLGVDLYNGSPSNYFDTMMSLNKDVASLRKESINLSNKQKRWIIDTMNPINKRISELQEGLLQGTKTLQDYNVELEGIIQPLKKVYIPKGMKQNYWLTYVSAAGNLASQIGGLIAKFKGLGLQEDIFEWDKGMEWMRETGEIPVGLQ